MDPTGGVGTGVKDVRILDQGNRVAELKRTERAAKAKASMAQIDKAAQEFETVFISQMMQHMFAGVDMSPMAEDGAAKEIYESMLIDEYAKLMSKTGGIGLAAHVKREMLKTQEIE
jgi:Rod binding domain-containing protein